MSKELQNTIYQFLKDRDLGWIKKKCENAFRKVQLQQIAVMRISSFC